MHFKSTQPPEETKSNTQPFSTNADTSQIHSNYKTFFIAYDTQHLHKLSLDMIHFFCLYLIFLCSGLGLLVCIDPRVKVLVMLAWGR